MLHNLTSISLADRTLLFSLGLQPIVGIDTVKQVFSTFGDVEKILVFKKHASTRALIQYTDVLSARGAIENPYGRQIFHQLFRSNTPGLTKLSIGYSDYCALDVACQSPVSR